MATGLTTDLSNRTLQTATSSFVVVFVVLILWLPFLTSRLDPLTGDEPFYVMTALSLVNDHDLDESNNYENRDFDSFYPAFGPTQSGWQSFPDPLPPHPTQTERPGLYSKHGLGLALIVALPWKLDERTSTLLVIAAISSLIAANMALLGLLVGATPGWATLVAVTLALSSPLLSFSLLIFPEMPAALCVIYAARRLLVSNNRWWQWLLVGASAAALPWFHFRLLPISLTLAALAVLRFRSVNRSRDWLFAGLFPLISAISLAVWMQYFYGSFSPATADHAGFSDVTGTLNGLAGTLFDQQWGALIHNVLLVLALAAFVPYARRHRGDAMVIAAVVVPYLLLISAYRVWWGEWNPPARYLTDVVPLFAAPLAWWLSGVRPLIASTAFFAAAIPTFAVTATFIADPQLMYNHPDGTSRLFDVWTDALRFDLTGVVPSYVWFSSSPPANRIYFALGGLALLTIISHFASRAIAHTGSRPDLQTVQRQAGDILARPIVRRR